MRDQLTDSSCDGASKRRLAGPSDFAMWGAEHGISLAKECLDLSRPARRRAQKAARRRVEIFIRQSIKAGASVDEITLYAYSFEEALKMQLAAGNQTIEVTVET
jgi:hypothetical protein